MSHEQHSYRITHGPYAAEILTVGATLSRLTHADRDLVAPAGTPSAPGFAGALLAPWPNRVVDGRYLFAGTTYELPINEQARHHAIHGFVHALNFVQLTPHTADTLELTATLEPSPGYPWRLRFTAVFALNDSGLRYGLTAENLSSDPAPYGVATHPYLVAGAGTVDEWRLELAVSERLEVTPDRLIPQHLAPWAAFAGPIAAARHDHAFTGIARAQPTPGQEAVSYAPGIAGSPGTATARVIAPDGSGVAITWDETCPWVQVFTTDLGDGVPGNRAALAIEPMTCAPDAFNASVYPFDAGLTTLAPGGLHGAHWRIAAI